MNDDKHDIAAQSAYLQQLWHGWGSPVGLGLGIFFLAAAVAVILVGISTLV